MTAASVLRELEALGTAQNRKVYSRHGVTGPCYGVSYADLGKLRKRIHRDHALAGALWASGIHDARVLATMIADPAGMTVRDLESWARDLDNYVVADAFAKLAAGAPAGIRCLRKWTRARGEWVGAAGWTVLALLAMQEGALTDGDLADFLEEIERRIHTAPNRVRHSMNAALIAIGGSRPGLRKEALARAGRIGPVAVDHGETGCKTPDAAAMIGKMAARRRGP